MLDTGTENLHWVLGSGAGVGHWLLLLDAGHWAVGTGTGHWHWVLGTATGWAMLLGAGQWSLVLGVDSGAGQCHWALVLGTGQRHWVLGSGTGQCHWVLGSGQYQWVLAAGVCPGCPPGPAPHARGSHSPKTIAGIASAVVLFIAIVTTIVCCFMCSCCYLYQRRRHPPTPLQGAGLGGRDRGAGEGGAGGSCR